MSLERQNKEHHSPCFDNSRNPQLTRSEIDDNIYQKYSIGEAVEGDPSGGEVIVEEGDGHGENDEVGHQKKQHAKVPVKSATEKTGNRISFDARPSDGENNTPTRDRYTKATVENLNVISTLHAFTSYFTTVYKCAKMSCLLKLFFLFAFGNGICDREKFLWSCDVEFQ